GTFRIRGFDVIDACLDAALGAGYRGIDTAASLPKRGRDRVGSVRRTRRAGPPPQRPEAARSSAARAGAPSKSCNPLGKLRHIGVSNYELHHLEELRRYTKTPCAVLQTECHPMLQRRDLRDYCANQGIHFQAYSSLGSTDYCQQLMQQHPTVLSCAQTAGCSPAQLLLRWAADLGIGALPKSIRAAHIAENAEAALRLSPLPDEVHSALAAMDCGQALLLESPRLFGDLCCLLCSLAALWLIIAEMLVAASSKESVCLDWLSDC
uniref:Aldo_ket_red domain-containing protein n=1 Tax=Macrostomum lignano TaxID=282301 RepID=A0A1I8FNJ5_9PLAT